jgi:hypothetical protein
MKHFEPGQLIVARSPYPEADRIAKPLLVLSASLNGDKETWTVEFIRGKKVVTSRMHPGSWKLLQGSA